MASSRAKKNRRSRRVSLLRSSVRLGLVFSVLVSINVYFFFFRGGTSLKQLQSKNTLARNVGGGAPDPAAGKTPEKPIRKHEPMGPGRIVDARLSDGETWARMLSSHGVSGKNAAAILRLLKEEDELTAEAGQRYVMRLDGENQPELFELGRSFGRVLQITRGEKGYTRVAKPRPVDKRQVELVGFVGVAVHDAFKQKNEDPSLADAFTDLFGWEVNLYTDTRPTDVYKILVDKYVLNGRFMGYGDIRAAQLSSAAGNFRAVHFASRDGRVNGFFNERGESVTRRLLKTPIKVQRVPPGFDRRRFQPVLHAETAQWGVDFAAPAGTPVVAMHAGVVTSVEGGTVVIKGDEFESFYSPLGRLARGLEQGETVAARQLLGHVSVDRGAPHLHYSLKQNGALVNALHVASPHSGSVPARYRGEFADVLAPSLAALEALSPRPSR